MAAKKTAAAAPVNKAIPKKKAALKKKDVPKQVVTKPAATNSKFAARKTSASKYAKKMA
jgi:hypothetical protein